jgi:hypothetical protein
VAAREAREAVVRVAAGPVTLPVKSKIVCK